MADETLSRDPNRITVNGGVTNDSDLDIVMFRVDPITKRLLVDAGEITVTGAGDGAILDGVSSAIKATVLDYTNSNPIAVRLTNTDGDYVGAGAGTQYSDGDANADPTGTVAMGTDGANIFALLTDVSGHLQIDVLSAPTTAVTGTFWQATQPVSIASMPSTPVTGTFWQATQPISGTVTANLGTLAAPLTIVGAGAAATALRVHLSDEALAALENITVVSSGTVTATDLDIRNLVAATDIVDLGGNALTSLQLIDNAISGAGFNITQFAGAAVPIGAGLEATALRVTLATDSTGVVSIDDNGGIITVDGTVAVTNAGITTIAGAVAGTEMQVDVLTMPTVTVNSHAVTNAGTFAVQAAATLAAETTKVIGTVNVAASQTIATTNAGTFVTQENGAALTALQLIDNIVGVEDAGETAGGGLAMAGSVRRDTPASSAGTTGDNATINTDAQGRLWVHPVPTAQDLATLATVHVKKYYTSAGAVTDGIIWSPAAGTRWFVTDIYVQVSAAATVTLEDDLAAGDSPIWKAELAANSGFSHSFQTPWFSEEDAADLICTTTAGNVYITVVGYEI